MDEEIMEVIRKGKSFTPAWNDPEEILLKSMGYHDTESIEDDYVMVEHSDVEIADRDASYPIQEPISGIEEKLAIAMSGEEEEDDSQDYPPLVDLPPLDRGMTYQELQKLIKDHEKEEKRYAKQWEQVKSTYYTLKPLQPWIEKLLPSYATI